MKKLLAALSASVIMLASVSALPASAAVSKPAVPQVDNAYSASTGAIRIKWAKIKGVSGYRVYRYDSSTKKWKTLKTISRSSTTEYKDSGLSPATKYKYKIKAYKRVNGKAVWGSASTVKNTTTKPSAAKFSKSSATKTSVTLNWNPVKCSGYTLYQKKDSKYTKITDIKDMNVSSFEIKNLQSDTEYSFKIKAYARDLDLTRQYASSDTKSQSTKSAVTWSKTMLAYKSMCEGKRPTSEEQELIRNDILDYAMKFNGQKNLHLDNGYGSTWDISYPHPLEMIIRRDLTDVEENAHMDAHDQYDGLDILLKKAYREGGEQGAYNFVKECRYRSQHIIDCALRNRYEIRELHNSLESAHIINFNIGFDEYNNIWFLSEG